MAAEAFAVMREGMRGKVGVGKLALYGREYLVAVRPQQRGIALYTLHHAGEIRSIDAVEELGSVPETVSADEMKLARQVIGTFEGPAQPDGLQGRVPRRAPAHHRREDRRRGDGHAGRGGAGKGREPHGGAEEEPGCGQRRQKTAREGRNRPKRPAIKKRARA